MNLPSSTELLMETPTGVPEYSSEEVLLTTYSVEKKNSISRSKLFAVTHLLYVPGTGRLCTGVMSSSETLRRISSREGQNIIPSLVSSTSESLHQYEEPAFGKNLGQSCYVL